MAKFYTDMSIDAYHSHGDIKGLGFDKAYISKSMLVDFMDCPARFKHKYIDGYKGDQKDFLNIGNAVHTLALEPELFKATYYILPEDIKRDARTKAYQEHLEAAGDKTIIREQDLGNIKGMAKALASNKKARVLFEAEGDIEASIFWTDKETGLKLRCRPDFMRHDGLIVDLKTTHSAKPDVFRKLAYDKAYDISVALTAEGYFALKDFMPSDYAFSIVETSAPHLIEAYSTFSPFDDDLTYLHVGQTRLKDVLYRLADCIDRNVWPGYSDRILPLSIPPYKAKEFTVGAQT